jgi:hypothetical protein
MDGRGRNSSLHFITINVTWGYGNREAISVEGFNVAFQGVVTKKIYIDQAIFSASPNPTIAAGPLI